MSGLRTSATVVLGAVILAAACNDSSEIAPIGTKPQIVALRGPSSAGSLDTVLCSPKLSGGSCPFGITVSFRLPEDQFITQALVRFQGDGSEDGVDRVYLVDRVKGLGAADQQTLIHAFVPPTIFRTNASLRYSVRLVTGLGEVSDPATLQLNIQEPAIDAGAEDTDASI